MKIIGFDFDGTVINIEEQKSKIFGEILNKKWGVGTERASKYWIDTGGSSRRSKFDFFFKERFGKELTDEDYVKIESEFSRILKEVAYVNIPFLPEALDVLKFCREKFDLVFCSSGVPTDEIKYLISLKAIEKYFDYVYGIDKKFKSKYDHFKEILSKHKPDLLIYVADGLEDMRVGLSFGAITIGIPSNHPEEDLKKAGAKYICSTARLIKILKTILKE